MLLIQPNTVESECQMPNASYNLLLYIFVEMEVQSYCKVEILAGDLINIFLI